MKNKSHSDDEKNTNMFDCIFNLLEKIPFFLSRATDEYEEFTATQTSNDVKSFVAYQTACRTALTHLQLLIKIAAWAEQAKGENIMADDGNDIDQLILEARAAIQDKARQKY